MTVTVAPVRVFISYAHDPALPGHVDRALDLATTLRLRGLEAQIDRYVEHTGVFWPRWMADQVREADFVLCLASPLYKERVEQRGDDTRGRGCPMGGTHHHRRNVLRYRRWFAEIPRGPDVRRVA